MEKNTNKVKNLRQVNHQQVIIKIDDAHDLSVVSLDGKPEIAILGPEGVMHDTVEPISNVKQLVHYLAKYFGGPINEV